MFSKTLSFMLVILLLCIPLLTIAQQLDSITQARIDAELDVKELFGWFAGSFLTSIACGCIGGSVIIGVSQVTSVTPPVHRFIGNPPEYISTYTLTYQQKTKLKRLIHTSAGCVGGSAIAFWLAYTLNVYNY